MNFGAANAYAYVIAAIGLVPALLYVGFLMRRSEVEV